jgi:putative transposase
VAAASAVRRPTFGSVAFLRLDGFLYDGRAQFWDETMAIDFKGSHFERDIILWGVRWYVAYPISYR